MKIVSRKELMSLPAGTVFSYYNPCVFRDLLIKESEPDPEYPDFVVSSLIGAVEHSNSDEFLENCERMERGESLPTDFQFSGREGLFDDEQLFAVYEKADVLKLSKRLSS